MTSLLFTLLKIMDTRQRVGFFRKTDGSSSVVVSLYVISYGRLDICLVFTSQQIVSDEKLGHVFLIFINSRFFQKHSLGLVFLYLLLRPTPVQCRYHRV